MPMIKTRKSPEDRRAEADRLHESIATQMDELTSTEGWQQFLQMATGFHRYSLTNLLLIVSQFPTATKVAGFRQWQARGRQVRKGERSIKIYGYATKKVADATEDGAEEIRKSYFPILSVFDVSQTDPIEGIEAPELAPRLKGDDDVGIFDAVRDWLRAQGWSIAPGEIGEANGATSHNDRLILINHELEPAQAAATLIHEAAHAIMHADVDDYHKHRGIYETEAESVAYIVAGVLGLDTSAKTIGYIAGWTTGDVEVVKDTAANVLAHVRIILDAITEPAATSSGQTPSTPATPQC